MQENVFVFFRLKEGYAMDLELPECTPVERVEKTMEVAA
jgi:hypothetical protein